MQDDFDGLRFESQVDGIRVDIRVSCNAIREWAEAHGFSLSREAIRAEAEAQVRVALSAADARAGESWSVVVTSQRNTSATKLR